SVETCATAPDALKAIERSRPDVVVADLGMPEMDGFELIRRIRPSTYARVSRVRAAALTAFARSEDRTKALRSSFEMHLAKPVDPGELVASVATLARRINPGAEPSIHGAETFGMSRERYLFPEWWQGKTLSLLPRRRPCFD